MGNRIADGIVKIKEHKHTDFKMSKLHSHYISSVKSNIAEMTVK